jgi:hypothetical protein
MLVGTSHYILDGREPRCTDPVSWRRWYESADRVVAKTQLGPDIVISTVFVGLDLGCDPGRPLVFETEVVEAGVASVDARRERYPTWAEAERGLAKIVDEYRGT